MTRKDTDGFTTAPYPIYDDDGRLIACEDWLGGQFTEGDPVVYCVTSSPGGRMAVGVVRKIEVTRFNERFSSVRVQVLTYRSAGSAWEDTGPRTKPAWVNGFNVTALPVRVPVVAKA